MLQKKKKEEEEKIMLTPVDAPQSANPSLNQ